MTVLLRAELTIGRPAVAATKRVGLSVDDPKENAAFHGRMIAAVIPVHTGPEYNAAGTRAEADIRISWIWYPFSGRPRAFATETAAVDAAAMPIRKP